MNARGMFKERIHIRQGDITQVRVEAIVNAANTTLLGGGGVDGTLHRAAGPALLEECRALGGCPTGESRMTGGHKLPAKYVIHAVGPLWRGGNANEPALLASCYSSALQLAHEYHLQTIAFPAISTGAYRFPFETATSIALEAVAIFLGKHDLPREVHLLFHTHTDYQKAVSIFERSPWAA